MDNIGKYIRSKLDAFKSTVSQTGQALFTPHTQPPVNNNYFNPTSNGGNLFTNTINSIRNTVNPIMSPVPSPVKITPYTSTIPGMLNTAKIKGYGALSALENDISRGQLYKNTPEFVNTFKQAPQTVGTFLGKVGEQNILNRPQQELLNKTVDLRTTAAQMRRSGNLQGATNLENTANKLQESLSRETNQYAKFREESKYKVPAAAARTALQVVGAKNVTPGGIALSATLAGGVAKAVGEDVPKAIARSTARLPEIMGVVRLGDPIAQKFAASVYTKLGGNIIPQLAARGITGMENVIESLTLDKLSGVDRKVHEYVTDFVIGAAMSNAANGKVKEEARRIFGKIPGFTQKQIDQASEEVVQSVGQARNKFGQYTSNGERWMSKVVPDIHIDNRSGAVSGRLLADAGGADLWQDLIQSRTRMESGMSAITFLVE